MPTKITSNSKRDAVKPADKFDIIIERSIGTVDMFGGTDNPIASAMKIIGESGEPGHFRFKVPGWKPGGEDLLVEITVGYE